jgi:phosphoserine phosphatase RsbU/P
LYDFYVDAETREKFQGYSRVKRWMAVTWRILNQAILRLTPARRLLFIVSLVVALTGGANWQADIGERVQFTIQINTLGYVLILVVLMLELKDKLLARDELETGRRVQMALMPEMQPEIPGWDVWMYTSPANDVGGDLVDYLKLDSSCHGLAIGDVAGKGLGAALLSAKLQATIRALAPMKKGVEWLGGQLNRIFHDDCLPNQFASLVWIELCVNSSKIEYLNAGHIPPVILTKGHAKVMPKGQTGLGLSKKTKYHKQTLKLQTGDYLLLYSDGLSEAKNEKGTFYEESDIVRLFEAVRNESAETVGRKLLGAVRNYIGRARQSDDLSIMVIKRESGHKMKV